MYCIVLYCIVLYCIGDAALALACSLRLRAVLTGFRKKKKKKTASVNRQGDKGKQHVQFLRHHNDKNIFYPASPSQFFSRFPNESEQRQPTEGRGKRDRGQIYQQQSMCGSSILIGHSGPHSLTQTISKAQPLHHVLFYKIGYRLLRYPLYY